MAPRSALVLGGARSGKSRFAERLAEEWGEPVLYVATATASDAEMAERIRQHQVQRPASWRTLEVPLGVAEAVRSNLGDARTVLVEDLTLQLSNLLVGPGHDVEQPAPVDLAERRACAEVDALLGLPARVVLVSNEVGMGLVPEYPLGRQFRDALGRLNQHAAAGVDEVYFLVAGVPMRLR
jgi:adenosylcobinamide kinase / adenosylcobinamide-phosphate guanylyltransferase